MKKYYSQLTGYGKFMYDTVFKFSSWIIKHQWLYYVLAHTWGLILTLIGYLISLCLLICGFAPQAYYWIYFFKVCKNWGGFEMGTMFVRDTTSWDKLNEHEFGHTFQNCLFGPFMLLLVSIPSAVRYWVRRIQEKMGKNLKPYDAIWFEMSATDVGGMAVEYIKNKKEN